MDLVLIRNVMIYFDVETKKAILDRLTRLLRPDGYLLLGGAETTFNLNDSYRRIEPLKTGLPADGADLRPALPASHHLRCQPPWRERSGSDSRAGC
jgi:hypothetical protein